MTQDNRVLGRKGARVLNSGEVEHVNGALKVQTETVCTLVHHHLDGDVSLGEC
jgi:hypothetical protein